MPYLLALDQGTTSSRSVLFGLDGAPAAAAQKEFPQRFPGPGWVEHDPEEIWQSQIETAREVLQKARVAPADVAAVGITNQRETTLVWDRSSGRPLHPAIVWQDRRTAGLTDRLKADGLQPLVRERTGLVLDPYFSASKLAWLLEKVPGLRSRADAGEVCFGTVDSWLLFRLTGGRVHATDVTNASRTLLFNIHTLRWDEDLLRVFGVPSSVLPEVLPSACAFGESEPSLLGGSVTICGVAGDQQAALFGQACLEPGMAKNTYGTGAFVVMNVGARAVLGEGVLTTLAWQLGGERPPYALEGSIFIAGAAVQWLRDGLGLVASAEEAEALARSVPDAAGAYFVPALVGLGSPHWDPHARGAIFGLTRGTTRAHLARAAIEAMAYQTRDAVEAMEAVSGVGLRELRADGGAAVNDLLLQFQADLLGRPVVRPRVTETTALGAAFLAGIGAGLFGPGEVATVWSAARRAEPAMSEPRRDALCRGWQRALDRTRGWTEG